MSVCAGCDGLRPATAGSGAVSVSSIETASAPGPVVSQTCVKAEAALISISLSAVCHAVTKGTVGLVHYAGCNTDLVLQHLCM